MFYRGVRLFLILIGGCILLLTMVGTMLDVDQGFQKGLGIESVSRLLFAFVSLIFLSVGSIVYFRRPKRGEALIFFLLCLVVAFFLSSPPSSLPPEVSWSSSMVIMFIPSLILHLFLLFPEPHRLYQSHRIGVIALVYLPLLALNVSPWGAQIPAGIARLTFLYQTLSVLLGMAIFLRTYCRTSSPVTRGQVKFVLWGLGFGFVPLFLASASGLIQYGTFLGPMRMTSLFAVPFVALVPISFGYALLRRRLLEVNLLVKRSFIYAMVLGFCCISSFVVVGLGKTLVAWPPEALTILATLLVASLLIPAKNGAERLIARSFFRKRYPCRRELRDLKGELPAFMDSSSLLRFLVSRLVEAVGIEVVIPLIAESSSDDYVVMEAKGIPSDLAKNVRFRGGHNGLVDLLRKEKRPLFLYDIDEGVEFRWLSLEDKVRLKKTRTVLAVPMFSNGTLVGILNLGLKARDYDSEDVALLSALASQTAVALNNTRIRQQEIVNQCMERELTVSRWIQEGMWSRTPPSINGWEVEVVNSYGKQMGGDFYDIISQHDGRLGLAIGDFSEWGAPAARIGASLQACLRALIGEKLKPTQVMTRINELLLLSNPHRSIPFFFGLLDLKNGDLAYVNAGHTAPLLIGSNGSVQALESGGAVLGSKRDVSYRQADVRMGPGDLVVMYSDGIFKANDHRGEKMADLQLRNTLALAVRQGTASAVEDLRRIVEDFSGVQAPPDDITVIAVGRSG